MPIIGKNGLSGYVNIFLNLVFFGGIGIYISLPFSLNWYLDYLNVSADGVYYFLLGFLYVTGLFCLAIVYELKKIFKTLNRMNPFMMDNVKSLKNMAICAFLISASYIVKIFVFNTFLTMIIAMIFIIAGLFSLILSEVFMQAVKFKEENDLTI